MLIDSPSNPRIKAATALRDRREREARGLTLVDGARESLRAIRAGVAVADAFICRALAISPDAAAAVTALEAQGRVTEVGERAAARLGYGDRADGVVLVVRVPPAGLANISLPADPLVVVTEDVEKPGNLGAILRSADAVGASAVIAAGGTDIFNPNVIRASIGTVFGVPVAAAPAPDVVAWLLASGLRIVAARVDAAALHVDTDLTGPVAIVLGSEAEGLSRSWLGPAIEGVRLPMLGTADSLNVSAAAAVLLYESWRQRRGAADGPPAPTQSA